MAAATAQTSHDRYMNSVALKHDLVHQLRGVSNISPSGQSAGMQECYTLANITVIIDIQPYVSEHATLPGI